MIYHTESVVRACNKALVIFDMPFGTYESSPEIAFKNASKAIRETGCDAVKLEGGVEMADTIRFLTSRGLCVVAHLGLMPQRVNSIGSYKKIRDDEYVISDALAIEEAGAFCVVLENITSQTAKNITEKVSIPTIGIGAGESTDGQVIVLEDICGLSLFTPPFAPKYADLRVQMRDAVKRYSDSTRNQK
jgi:3-methyl-2-oxobutanoate hydroxymethyltransferase